MKKIFILTNTIIAFFLFIIVSISSYYDDKRFSDKYIENLEMIYEQI